MSQTVDVLVIGMGAMGHGIAHVAAQAGCQVQAHDVSGEAIERGLAQIRANLDRGVEKGKVTPEAREATLSRIQAAPDLQAAASMAGVIVEAAPESLDMKREIFRRIDAAADGDALLASNTSSLPIGKIAEAVRHPERVIGMHFFNPVHLMPLLELVRADVTSDETVARAQALGVRMGKETILVRDTPGFATSRLGIVLGLEAIRMVEQAVASPDDIDKAMALGYRHPMGPLRLTDLVGLDVRLAIAEHLYRELGTEAFRPPELLRSMVAEGRLGKKCGRGFYEW